MPNKGIGSGDLFVTTGLVSKVHAQMDLCLECGHIELCLDNNEALQKIKEKLSKSRNQTQV
jgi:hypothetical protein